MYFSFFVTPMKMKAIKLLFLLLFFYFGSNLVVAQSQQQLIKVGNQLFEEGDYYAASLWYKNAMNVDSSLLELRFKYAEALRLYNEYQKAEYQYYYIFKEDRGKTFPLAPFWYATMLKYNGNYNDAKKSFKRIKNIYSSDKKGYHYQKVVQEIKSCEKAIEISKDTLLIDIKNAGKTVNTYNSELGGRLILDSILIYASLRDEKMKDDNEILDTSLYLTRLFSSKKSDNTWEQGEKLEELINVPNLHIANGSMNENETVFYFTQCDRKLNCNVFGIKYNNGKFEPPVFEVENINSENFTTTQPFSAIINDKEVLFFSSNRTGGKGKMDIWYAIKNEFGVFEQPINAGKSINSIDNEITPFYNNADTALYFSSDWHEGLGGFDVFKAKKPAESFVFEKPINAGIPINSSVNDFYYSMNKNLALLTSNRVGSYTKKGETCCNDIYYYEIPDTIKPIYTSLEEMNRYLPVKLYFHNDYPNPRTRDTLTTLTYDATYKDYTRMYNQYRREYAADLKKQKKIDAEVEIDELFSNFIDKGMNDLILFTPLLIVELEKGKEITLTIKGYASPLSKTDYNVNLTLRRISSLINYLNEYENGKIAPYMNGTAVNGGKLNFIKVPFGEYQANTISDDLADQRNSVFSPAAALERKIEIIAIAESDTNNVALDGSELEKLPLLTFKDTLITFEPTEFEKQVRFINNGEAPLKIFEATFTSQGFEAIFPTEEIPSFEIKYLTIKRTSETTNCNVIFLTNGVPNQISKQIIVKD